MVGSGPVISQGLTEGVGQGSGAPEHTTGASRLGETLPRRIPADNGGDHREQLTLLRRFFFGDARAGAVLEPVQGCLPALLDPYREVVRLRFDYPLVLHGARPTLGPHQIATPLSEVLRIAAKASGEDTPGRRILSDNLPRLEGVVQALLKDTSAPTPAAALLSQAAERMQAELSLDAQNRARLGAAVDQLLATLSSAATLLRYSRHAGVHLMLHALLHRLVPRQEQLRETLHRLAHRLRDVLRVERAKGEQRQAEQGVQQRVGSAGARFLDAAALSQAIGSGRGSASMPAQHRARIEQALGIIEAHLATTDIGLVTVVHNGLLPSDIPNGGLPSILHASAYCRYHVQVQASAAPCLQSQALFDEQAAQFARVIGALRTAQLELDGLHELEAYEPWLEIRSWGDLTPEELLLAPVVVALVSADPAAEEGLGIVSRLLRSGRPVQLMVQVAPGGRGGGIAEAQTLRAHRLEIGYLGVCHRQAWVQQSSAARPQHLLAGYLQALDQARTGLHILSGEGAAQTPSTSIHPWLLAGSAIEARAHPLFHFQPPGGRNLEDMTSIGQLNLEGNPQPECDWPIHELRYTERDGSEQRLALAFTFADFALLDAELGEQFRLLPEGLESPNLVPLTTYLARNGEANRHTLPFIWVVDTHGSLRRALVARELVLVAEDRQSYWRTLQAYAGVRNPHVVRMQKQMQAQALEQLAAERQQLEAAYRTELAQARKDAARQAMRRLADALLGLDLEPADGTPSAADNATRAVPAVALAGPIPVLQSEGGMATSAPLPVEAPPIPEETAAEPWIDTPLCTSCNDCININPQLFSYDENKQAYIHDARAGSYAQLVEAAERCPARCIHPGLPLDRNEPDEDALIARGTPFNA